MRSFFRLGLAACAAFALAACGKPFDVKTAPGFVALENQGAYEYRATTPEGVVLGVRVIDDEKRGDVDFWTQAIVLQVRDVSGYALLENAEITSKDGTKGRLLKFGHDQDKKPYVYWLALFAAQHRLFIVEAGGTKETFDRSRPSVEWMLQSVKVRCDTFVSPVLASRTCNKW